MLAGAGLGDDASLAHAFCQQDLPHAGIHLVGAGVVQFFALEIDLGATEQLCEALGKPERAGAAHIILQIVVELLLEARIFFRRLIGGVELKHERHQRLGDEPAAIVSKPPMPIRPLSKGIGQRCRRDMVQDSGSGCSAKGDR